MGNVDPPTDEFGRPIFFPKDPLSGKKNYKRYFRIERTGSVSERVYLTILDKRHREEIICRHFMQSLVRHRIKKLTGITILGRDNPWDFRLGLDDGTIFNLEIVSIADNDHQLETLSREERRGRAASVERIPLRELTKIARHFPEERLEALVEGHHRLGTSLDEMVPNPFFLEGPHIFISRGLPHDGTLAQRLARAISGKERKKHLGKEETVLVIDNRSSVYYVDDVLDAFEVTIDRIDRSPFMEIWFYNGYCSDDDGANAEYVFICAKPGIDKSLMQSPSAS